MILPAVLLTALTCPAGLPAQDTVAAARSAKNQALARALLQWVVDFEDGRIQIQGTAVLRRGGNVDYIETALQGNALEEPAKNQRTTHLTLLQRLIGLAEEDPTPEVARPLLALAALGFAKDMFEHRTMMVRDLGHFALLRIEAPGVWEYIHRRAIEPPDQKELDAHFDFDARTMWRVAAIRLLGMKEKSVFRSSVEKCLADPDSRVRLAAAESLGFMKPRAVLPTLTRVLTTEEHPMVVVALIQAIQQILDKHALEVPVAQSELALRTALGRLNQVDWRSDMAIVQLIHNHPIKAAVPPFIRLMRQSRGEVDPILKIINKNASRFLGLEAHRALRRITGALIPDDPEKWEAFWAASQDELVVERRSPADKTKTYATQVGGSFYGIPVLGNEVVFVIDTSGSMKAKVMLKPDKPTTGPRSPRHQGTRLSVAKWQTLKAIQGMPGHARFSIVTFHSTVHVWNEKPVPARRSARHRAASILNRLKPDGGTNVFDALIRVLEGRNAGYGQKPTSDVDEVFVLSDGEPSSGVLTDTEEILRVIREVNKVRRVRIHTVFAGEAGGGADFMRKLAEQNGGVFVQQ